MGFIAKLECDADGCYEHRGKLEIECEPWEADFEFEKHMYPKGEWLHDEENEMTYCPKHAEQAAQELGLKYSKKKED